MRTDQTSTWIARTVIAVAIIIFGIVLLIDLYVKFVDIDVLLRWWPTALVLVGLLIASTDKKQALLGVSVALAGVIVLMGRFDLVSDDLRRVVEIIVLLLIGLAVVTPRSSKKGIE